MVSTEKSNERKISSANWSVERRVEVSEKKDLVNENGDYISLKLQTQIVLWFVGVWYYSDVPRKSVSFYKFLSGYTRNISQTELPI